MAIELSIEKRRELAETIRARMIDGEETILVLYEPGDMTHYEFLFANARAHPPVGACRPEYAWALHPRLGGRDVRWTFGWIDSTPTIPVSLTPHDYYDPSYVAEHLPYRGRPMAYGSAVVVAELLSMVAGVPEDTLERMREQHRVVLPEEPS